MLSKLWVILGFCVYCLFLLKIGHIFLGAFLFVFGTGVIFNFILDIMSFVVKHMVLLKSWRICLFYR